MTQGTHPGSMQSTPLTLPMFLMQLAVANCKRGKKFWPICTCALFTDRNFLEIGGLKNDTHNQIGFKFM